MVASASGVRPSASRREQVVGSERAFEAALLGQVDALIAVDDYLSPSPTESRIVDFAAISGLPPHLRDSESSRMPVVSSRMALIAAICFAAPPPTSIEILQGTPTGETFP